MDHSPRPGAATASQVQGKELSYNNLNDTNAAFELVADRTTKAPLPPAFRAFDRLTEAAYQRGLIIYPRRSRGGYAGDHLIVAPPMITTPAQVEEILGLLTEALDGLVVRTPERQF